MSDQKLQRNTCQRIVILDELKKLTTHPTAVELYGIVREILPRISLGTVYRNLEVLAANGTIQKLETGDGSARFDGNPEAHYHVRCIYCGKVDDIHDFQYEPVGAKHKKLSGYNIVGFKVEFLGICPGCQATG